jgi:hypothetical protein
MKANEFKGVTSVTAMQHTNDLHGSRFTVRIIASSALAAAFGLIGSSLAADVGTSTIEMKV